MVEIIGDSEALDGSNPHGPTYGRARFFLIFDFDISKADIQQGYCPTLFPLWSLRMNVRNF
jgi:hypothetical protein